MAAEHEVDVFDFGAAYNQKNDENFLANAAARYASVNSCKPCSTGQTIGSYVKTTADTNHLRDTATVAFCLPALSGGGTNDGSVGNPLRVKVSAPYSWLGALRSSGLPGGTITITTTVTTRILQSSDGTHYTAAACS